MRKEVMRLSMLKDRKYTGVVVDTLSAMSFTASCSVHDDSTLPKKLNECSLSHTAQSDDGRRTSTVAIVGDYCRQANSFISFTF